MFNRLCFAFALVALAVLPACGGGGSSATPGGGGGGGSGGGSFLRIHITDAPFPSEYVDSATVVIEEVRVRNKDVDGWQTVFTGSAEIDLVPLVGGVTELLVDDAVIEPGTYDEVRLIVQAGEVVVSDKDPTDPQTQVFNTENGDLKFPSGAQTGIKVKIDNDIVVNEGTTLSHDLILDFDLEKSFVFNGPMKNIPNVNSVLFKPVVRATNASINGRVVLDVNTDSATPGDTGDDAPLAGATVRLFDALDQEVTTAMTDAFGHAEISAPPGPYTITVEAEDHESEDVPEFQIFLANATDVGVITLAALTEIGGTTFSDGATPGDTSDDVVLGSVLVEVRMAGDPSDATPITTTTSSTTGAFLVADLGPGDYDLYFSKAGAGFGATTALAVASSLPGTGTPVEARLPALTQDVSGAVTDGLAAVVVGAIVSIRNENGVEIASTTTDGSGSYTLLAIPTGSHTLRVDDAGTLTDTSIDVLGTDPVSTKTVDVEVP